MTHPDADACRRLWLSVTADDLAFLRALDGGLLPGRAVKRKLRRILESPPESFLAGAWFEQLCALLSLDPGRVRDGIQRRVEAA